MPLGIRKLRSSDWDAVRAIYQDGIATGHATFELTVPSWEHWDATHLSDCRLVAQNGDDVLGWAALSPVSDRCVYGGVAETSVYVGAATRGQGVGKALLTALIAASEAAGIWTLQAGILPENVESVALHKAHGFRVGYRERSGQMRGTWRDTLLLERRSSVVGV